MNRAYLSLGSSLDKERNLRAGVGLLAEHGRVLAVSSAYETAPIGNPDDPTFLNAALILETPLEPQALKETVLRAVEDRLGRQRTSDPNAPRTFDADISLFNDEILDVGRRHIPDPEILLYAHIAVPLAEIAPNYRHPETGETLAAIARRVSLDTTMIRRDDVSLWCWGSGMTAETLALFPDSARIDDTGSLVVGGCNVRRMADQFGTPLYLYDGETLDRAVEAYRTALSRCYPGAAQIAYAAKAWLCSASARWIAAKGIGLDVVSGGELAIALHGGVPADHIHFHGNNKSDRELAQALDAGVGRIVVDHPDELERLDELAIARGRRQAIWLRVNPDVDTDTHHHTQTGHAASKFGLSLRDGTAEAVALDALRRAGVELAGLHCHIGSQLRDAEPLAVAAQRLLDLAARLRDATGWQPAEMSTGGGWAVAYTAEQLADLPPVETYVARVSEAVVQRCRQHELALPRLVLEPGRSLVARAGVAVYTVGALKPAGDVTYAFVDGGLADNPRHALYGATYTALLANRRGDAARQRVHVAGPYCETGDVLIEDIELPPLVPGDLLAVPVSGAYQLSMASNYNAALRPAVVWLEDGQATLVQRRETLDDLLRRDLV